MRILVACEFSGVVRRALSERGHDVWSCDLEPAEDGSEKHVQGDARPLLLESWGMVIAHPPCTRLCNSGVRWLHERNLWAELDEAAAMFRDCLNANAPMVAVENPVMHKYAVERVGRKHNFSVQPYEHGDPYTKRTCFWTRGLPPITPTNVVPDRYPAVHRMAPGPDRAKERSRTYPGIARAIAQTWG